MNIDFRAQDVATAYVDMSNNIVNAFLRFLGEMEAKCRKHGYAPMVNFVKSLQEFYKEDLRIHVRNEYQNWESSDYSLENLARRLNAGSGAEYTGKRYMNYVSDAIEQMFNRPSANLQIDIDAPALSEKDISDLGEDIRHFARDAQQAKEQSESYVNSRAGENLLFACTRPIIISTGESIVECFTDMIREALEAADMFQNTTDRTRELIDGFKNTGVQGKKATWPADVPFR